MASATMQAAFNDGYPMAKTDPLWKMLVFAAALLLPFAAIASSSDAVRLAHTSAQLHSAYEAVDARAPFPVLFHLSIDDHWHTYWRNPGDSGIPTGIEWT